jgi:hypothetical protein
MRKLVSEPLDGRYWIVSIEADGERTDVASYQTVDQARDSIARLRQQDQMAADIDKLDAEDRGYYERTKRH